MCMTAALQVFLKERSDTLRSYTAFLLSQILLGLLRWALCRRFRQPPLLRLFEKTFCLCESFLEDAYYLVVSHFQNKSVCFDLNHSKLAKAKQYRAFVDNFYFCLLFDKFVPFFLHIYIL